MQTRIRGVGASRCCATFTLVVVVFVVALASSCTTPTSRIRVPACADSITVTGQHARGSNTTLLLDHSFDLPFTETEIFVEGRDGEVTKVVVRNSMPDVVRLLGGGVLAAVGAALVTHYGVSAAYGDGSVDATPFWALPVGLLVGGVGGAMMLTGWHPPQDTVIDYQCPVAPSGDAPPAFEPPPAEATQSVP